MNPSLLLVWLLGVPRTLPTNVGCQPSTVMASMRTRTIRDLSDLAAVPESELGDCLRALRDDIRRARARHDRAVRNGLVPANSAFAYDGFTWRRRTQEVDASLTLHRETPIGALPLRPSAKRQLRELRVLCLDDLTAISEDELLRMPDVGRGTLSQLREWLNVLGLGFMPPVDADRRHQEQSRAIRSLEPEQRGRAVMGLADSAPVSQLGLRPQTLNRALSNGHATVGDLRALTLRTLSIKYGKSQVREICAALSATGTGLRCKPTDVEMWRCGALELSELVQPDSPSTPVADLEPWLGAAVRHLERHGVRTLGELQALAGCGRLAEVPGIGAATAERVLAKLASRSGQKIVQRRWP